MKHEMCIRDRAHSYPYGKELLAFLGRVALTVGIEVLAALPFGLWRCRQLKVILKTNIATQGCLNVGVNLFTYFGGALAGATMIFMTPVYLLAELVVVGQELITYHRLLSGQDGVTKVSSPYTLIAMKMKPYSSKYPITVLPFLLK